jgi:hypothetical protein
MGQSASAIRKAAEAAEEAEKIKLEERLQILERMITGRLRNAKNNILAGQRNDEEIHAGIIVEELQHISIVETEKGSDDIKGAVDDFFSGNFMKGIGDIVSLTVSTILGNESVGEYESTDMFIVWHNNALLRYDLYTYRWNFSSKGGVIENTEGVTGAFMCKRVIDLTQTDPQVLTWAISRQAAITGIDASSMIDSAMKILEKIVDFKAKIRMTEAAAGQSDEMPRS